MKTLKLLAVSSITGVVLAGSLAAPAFAWHPEVKITKYVQNQTAGSQMEDANDATSAVATKPGDTIKYTMVIENTAEAHDLNHNDLHYTKLADKLPAGVELVSDAAKREITEDLGVLKPGQKVTKEYLLKVTSTKDGDVILNEACVTGDSQVKDAPRKDCDTAVVKVKVPTVPQVLPKEMPVTGPANIVATAGTITILGYLGNLLRLKRRASKSE
jgi:uncharacterized repeat protein (TIGR01451 family)